MRLVDIVVAFPFYVLIIALVFVLGPGQRSIYIAITLVGWVSYARIIRGEILVAKRQEYVLAAQSGGLSAVRIIGRHLLPNVITQAIIYAMSDIVQDILAIVTLGYLGLGVPPPTPDLGYDDQRRPELPDHALAADHVPRTRVVVVRPGAVADRRRARRPAQAGSVMSEMSFATSSGAAQPSAGPMLEVSDLHVEIAARHGTVRAVDGVSLEVAGGEARRPGRRVRLGQEHDAAGDPRRAAARGARSPRARSCSTASTWCRCPTPSSTGSAARRSSMIFQEPMSALNPVMRVGHQIAEGPRVHLGYSRSRPRSARSS